MSRFWCALTMHDAPSKHGLLEIATNFESLSAGNLISALRHVRYAVPTPRSQRAVESVIWGKE
jgi:hypothetical protein